MVTATATAGPARAAAPVAALPLLTWHSALANRRYAPAVIAVLGSSSSEGVGTTGPGRDYPHVLVENLRSMFPVAGAAGGDNYVAAWGTPKWWPVALTGSGTRSKTAGWGLKAVDLTGAGQTLTYTFTGTGAQVWYSGTGRGTFAVAVDGVTVAATVGADALDGQDAQWTSASLAPGRHTIVVTCLSAGARIHGFATFDGDAGRGIHLYNGGHGGRTSGDFATGVRAWAPRLRAVQPHLVILQLGVNDWRSGVPAAVMKENLRTIISAVRGHTDIGPSFVIYGPPRVTVDRRVQDFAHFTEAWQEIAAEDAGGHGGGSGVAYFDLAARQVSPSSDNSLGLYCDDRLHMSDKGAAFTADALAAFLAP